MFATSEGVNPLKGLLPLRSGKRQVAKRITVHTIVGYVPKDLISRAEFALAGHYARLVRSALATDTCQAA